MYLLIVIGSHLFQKLDGQEIDLQLLLLLSMFATFIIYIPSLILLIQYFQNNKELEYEIEMRKSNLKIISQGIQTIYKFEDIVESKIYQTNFKDPNFIAVEYLPYADFGYWYLRMKDNSQYRFTSLMSNVERMPIITDTEIEYVTYPNFKKEYYDYEVQKKNNISFWKSKFKNLNTKELLARVEQNDYLEKNAQIAIMELLEEKGLPIKR